MRFVSLATLRASLAAAPKDRGLVRAREADDEVALAQLALDPEIAALARGPEAVSLLWEVCCIPDFGKVTGEGHARLLAQMFRFLVGADGGRGGRLPTDWVARQVDRINRTDGDIETLMQRIASVRTWTYVSHRSSWLDDASGWQERTRAIEDKLSDALHQRLIQRFVDKRTALLVGRMRGNRDLRAAVNAAGEVSVEGHFVGTLDGFRFAPDAGVTGGAREAGRSVQAAALRALSEPIRSRVAQLEADDDDAFALDEEGGIFWRGASVACLRPGRDVLTPRIEPLTSDLLDSEAKLRLVGRLTRWLRMYLRHSLAPLFIARETTLSGPARGLLYQLSEALGSLPRHQATTQLAALPRQERKSLAQGGLLFGRESVFYPRLLKPRAMALRALLWSVHVGAGPVGILPFGRPTFARQPGTPEELYAAAGYRVLSSRAVRVDVVEQIAGLALRLSRRNARVPGADLMRLLGCDVDELAPALAMLGYRIAVEEAGIRLFVAPRVRPFSGVPRRAARNQRGQDSTSPFAALQALRSAR